MAKILEPVRVPLIALAIGLAGVGLAWLWFDQREEVAVAAGAVGIALGSAANWFGRKLLPNHPVGALRLLEGWILIPIALATAASAAVVIVTVELTLPNTTPTDTKELVGAVTTGIAAFLTAAFISWAGDDKDSTLADHVKASFQDRYTRPNRPKPGAHAFAPDSAGEKWVFAEHFRGVSGWGRPARHKRAKGIAHELAAGTSEPSSNAS